MNEAPNPYQSPETASDAPGEGNRSHWCLPLGEFVIVAAIIGGLVGLLVPSVEAARNRNGFPSQLPESLQWINHYPMPFLLAMVAGCAVTAFSFFWVLRSVAPAWLLPYIPWWKKKAQQPTSKPT